MADYAGAIKALRNQLDAIDAEQAPGVYTPEQIAERRRRNAAQAEAGLLAQVGGFQHLKGVGEMLSKQAAAEAAPRITTGGVYDPLAGEHTLFPEVLQEARRKRLESDISRIDQARLAADAREEAAQARAHERLMLKRALGAGAGAGSKTTKGSGTGTPASPDTPALTTKAKSDAWAAREASREALSQMNEMEHIFQGMNEGGRWEKDTTAPVGFLNKAKGYVKGASRALENDVWTLRLTDMRNRLAAIMTRTTDANPTRAQVKMLLDTFPGYDRGPTHAAAWLASARRGLQATYDEAERKLAGQAEMGADPTVAHPDAGSAPAAAPIDELVNKWSK